jgi:hypothetical protein
VASTASRKEARGGGQSEELFAGNKERSLVASLLRDDNEKAKAKAKAKATATAETDPTQLLRKTRLGSGRQSVASLGLKPTASCGATFAGKAIDEFQGVLYSFVFAL